MEKVKTFQVKEVCDICRVTRKALLIYEQKGLLVPYYINSDTGYRYYNAENISKIMVIRKYQSFGFSLDEIYDYLHDTKKLSEVYDRLNKLRDDLNETIEQLHLRMMTEEYDSQQIVYVTLPNCCYYTKSIQSNGYMEALNSLRETHLDAIKTDRADKMARMFSAVMAYDGEYPNIYGSCLLRHAIPMVAGYVGPNALVEPETRAVCVFHRGAYTSLAASIRRLMDYCRDNGLHQTAPMRLVWLEGPPIHGQCEDKYLTQIVIPI